jgi:hypothetical protein
MKNTLEPREVLGRVLGVITAPGFFAASLLRRKRIFHPSGVFYLAEVRPLLLDGPAFELAVRLAGPAIVRLSGGIWKWPEGRKRPDILGVSVRFRGKAGQAADHAESQDLIFLSIPSLLLLPISPFITSWKDYLSNRYYTDAPFVVAGVGKVKFRMVPQCPSPTGEDRRERLARATALGQATLRLEMRPLDGRGAWVPVADIELRQYLPLDDEELSFNPWRTGLGVRPYGFVQAMRAAVYPASQLGRQVSTRLIRARSRAFELTGRK